MLPFIALYGTIGGLIIAVPMVVTMLWFTAASAPQNGVVYGYVTMLIALTAVFLGVKRYRDKVLGGAIKFGPALVVGLGISAVASLFYAIGWEISLALTGFDFAGSYTEALLAAAHKRGASPAELQQVVAENARFVKMYGNPLYRLPLTFIEMFPVGVLVSLITAGLLRNSRMLPARARA
jgi:Protein of unknown function (DUF4199)